MVRLFAHEPEPRRLIDTARGDQYVVGPQGEFPVAKFARERGYQACADGYVRVRSAPQKYARGTSLNGSDALRLKMRVRLA
jgi:hypothetical protein